MVSYEEVKTVKAKPVSLNGLAPSFHNERLKMQVKEFHSDGILPTVQYLISDNPIDLSYFRVGGGYSSFEFEYKNQEILMFTNHGINAAIEDVVEGKLDLGDLVHDLVCLAPMTFNDKETFISFKKEVQEKLDKGLEKKIVNDDKSRYRVG